MNKKEKIRRYKGFIASEKFTEASYGILMVFHENIQRIINLAELHVILLKRIESGDIQHNFPEPIILKIKQLILVDVLSKIMTMIESILVLFDTFSRYSKRKIPSRMIKYRQPSVDTFIKRFQSDEVNLRKLAGFPNLKFLRRNCSLDENEMMLICEVLENSGQYVKQVIARIINFYQSKRVVYGKFKHGLLFQSGFSPTNLSPTAPEDLSLFFAFDRQTDRPQRICFEGKLPPKIFDWFNVYSILPCSDLTIKRYTQIMKDIKDLSDYVLGNHLSWGWNCGEDYLPMKKINGELFVHILGTRKLTEDQYKLFKEICEKVYKNVNFPRVKFQVIFNFSQEKMEKIKECFSRDQCATIWHVLTTKN